MKEVLLVKVSGAMSVEVMRQMREYVIESICRDVLVIDDETTVDIMEMPEVGLPVIVAEAKKENPIPPAPAAPDTLNERAEKQKILERLTKYRDKNGLGCLSAVAKKACRKGISDNILRMLISGDATVTIQDWRAIGKALDKLEEENKSDKRQKGGANA